MTIKQFIKHYSEEYVSIFHEEEIVEEQKIEIEEKKVNFSKKIATFLFEPRYKVDNLKFRKA